MENRYCWIYLGGLNRLKICKIGSSIKNILVLWKENYSMFSCLARHSASWQTIRQNVSTSQIDYYKSQSQVHKSRILDLMLQNSSAIQPCAPSQLYLQGFETMFSFLIWFCQSQLISKGKLQKCDSKYFDALTQSICLIKTLAALFLLPRVFITHVGGGRGGLYP